MKCLVIDDEALARERLVRLLAEREDWQVCGQAANGEQGLAQVQQLHPDVVLLDIRMPGLDGMETAARLSRLAHPPALIFCTAYDHYAIQAFEVQATAYLVKPVRKEALAEALARAGRLNRVQQQTAGAKPPGGGDQLAVRTYRGTVLIDLADVRYCEADHKYVTIHHTGGDTVSDFTLKELEARYPRHLLRIHRNTLVGVRHVAALERTRDGQHRLRLRDSSQCLAVSRRHAGAVRQWLQNHQPG